MSDASFSLDLLSLFFSADFPASLSHPGHLLTCASSLRGTEGLTAGLLRQDHSLLSLSLWWGFCLWMPQICDGLLRSSSTWWFDHVVFLSCGSLVLRVSRAITLMPASPFSCWVDRRSTMLAGSKCGTSGLPQVKKMRMCSHFT